MALSLPSVLPPPLATLPPAGPPAATVVLPLDPLLVGMVGRGHGIEAICLTLGLTRAELDDRLVALDLPTPHDRPLRKAGGRHPWSLIDIHRLIPWWLEGLHAESIGERLGRSTAGVRSKAHRLGLPRRDRKAVFRAPLLSAPKEIHTPGTVAPESGNVVALPLPFPAEILAQPVQKRVERTWTPEEDEELARRSWANQHWKAIARDMGRTPASVRSRQTRLQLPRHERALLVDQYDPSVVEANVKAAGYVKRTCQILKRVFWAPRTGDRFYCREAKRTRAYQDRHGGADERYIA